MAGERPKRVSPKELGARIRALRAYQNLSQEELGDSLGVRGSTISRIESGTRPMTVDFFGRLCVALKTTEAELLYETSYADWSTAREISFADWAMADSPDDLTPTRHAALAGA